MSAVMDKDVAELILTMQTQHSLKGSMRGFYASVVDRMALSLSQRIAAARPADRVPGDKELAIAFMDAFNASMKEQVHRSYEQMPTTTEMEWNARYAGAAAVRAAVVAAMTGEGVAQPAPDANNDGATCSGATNGEGT